MKKILLLIAVGIAALLALTYVFGVFSVAPSNKVDVGFMFDNAPTADVMGHGALWIDETYNSALSSSQGGFVSLVGGSDHTFKFQFTGLTIQSQSTTKTFVGSFHVPNSVPEGQCVIVHIDWNSGIVSVVTQAK